MPGPSPSQIEREVDAIVSRGLTALPDVAAARQAANELAQRRGDRAVFALCLLTLELALLKDEQAKAELPRYVGVLLQAHHDPQLASLLTASNPQLASRWARVKPVVAEFVAAQGGASASTPHGGPLPRLATPLELIEEIQLFIDEAPAPAPPRPPPLPPQGPARSPKAVPPALPSDASATSVDAEAEEFWKFASEALGRVPNEGSAVVGVQSFAADKAGDRARLVRFAHDLLARFPTCAPARALSSLVLLFVAAQQKERSLTGPNRERADLLRTGLTLQSSPEWVSRVAVLFETDGTLTRQCFGAIVEVMNAYLAFCLRQRLDPKSPDTVRKYTSA